MVASLLDPPGQCRPAVVVAAVVEADEDFEGSIPPRRPAATLNASTELHTGAQSSIVHPLWADEPEVWEGGLGQAGRADEL